MLTMLHSMESQASCSDEHYLLIINFLCTIWSKLIGGGNFKSKAHFDLLILIIFLKKTDQK